MKKLTIPILIVVVAILAVVCAVLVINKDQPSLGSITTGQEYTATTTPTGNGEWDDHTIKAGWGALGSVIVTLAGDLEYVLYDATSTGAIANDSRFSKADQQLIRIPGSLVAGTYVFDVIFTDGLVMDVESGTTGTTTITFR